jgi:hypothetical protein
VAYYRVRPYLTLRTNITETAVWWYKDVGEQLDAAAAADDLFSIPEIHQSGYRTCH